MSEVIQSFQKLKTYCETENFEGWDPYDGLNSKVFQTLPLKHWDLARLAWIQGFKRSPVNFRKLLLVPKKHNSKGIALMLSGYCQLYEASRQGKTEFGTSEVLLDKIEYLADLLLKLSNKSYSGACWGYSFDWQSKAFFLPYNTPTVVATAFCVEALFSAFEITKNESFYDVACSAANFVLNDLNRIKKPKGDFMFSYSPIDNRAVYNASLLGSKILAMVYGYTKDETLKEVAVLTANAVCKMQNEDGSFPHSDQIGNTWRDSFHTGFKLEALEYCRRLCEAEGLQTHIDKGFKYWINNYFNHETGFSFYYDRNMQPTLVDLHCVSQAISTIFKLNKTDKYSQFLNKIVNWAIDNMQSSRGYFYFQRKKGILNKIEYLRWPNAWMFYGLSYYLLHEKVCDT